MPCAHAEQKRNKKLFRNHLLLTPTIVAGVKRSSASLCASVCMSVCSLFFFRSVTQKRMIQCLQTWYGEWSCDGFGIERSKTKVTGSQSAKIHWRRWSGRPEFAPLECPPSSFISAADVAHVKQKLKSSVVVAGAADSRYAPPACTDLYSWS